MNFGLDKRYAKGKPMRRHKMVLKIPIKTEMSKTLSLVVEVKKEAIAYKLKYPSLSVNA